ncbi:MAG: hypothetical protein AB3N64_08355 [Puniceicoccaceae bacterium]
MRNPGKHFRTGVVVRQYDGTVLLREQVEWISKDSEEIFFEVDNARLRLVPLLADDSASMDFSLEWQVERGSLIQTAVGICLTFPEWSVSGYPWLAGAVYNGNRFEVREQAYSPRYPEADCGPNAETVIADIPHLQKGEGDSQIQLLLGDLSAPAMGYVDADGKWGVYVCSEQIDTADLFEIRESPDRQQGSLSILRGGVREKRYAFPELNSQLDSDDRAPDLQKGDSFRQHFRIHLLEEATIQSLFDAHFDWMMSKADFPRSRISRKGPSLSESFKLIEEKYNRDNWDEANELFATECDPSIHSHYQIGWCGGGIADSALLCGKHHLTRERAERALNRLCREGQLPSGFFYGKRNRDGDWTHDFAADKTRPYTHGWTLVRRQADLLLFLLKAIKRPASEASPDSIALWKYSAGKLADALCGLFARNRQLGQFVDAESGAIVVGGSASGGVIPAGLCLAHQAFNDPSYLRVAEEIGQYFLEEYTAKGLSSGGPGDACQAPDSESCAGLLESYVTLFECTGKDEWLQAAKSQAAQVASWIMPYDFPFPESSEFGRLGIPTTGSVFANAQNKHSAPGICTHSGDCLRRLSRITGDPRYEELLRWIARQISWTVSREDRPIHDSEGMPLPPGWINERVNTSDWDNNLGGVFYGSTWSEVALMLMAVEVGDVDQGPLNGIQ